MSMKKIIYIISAILVLVSCDSYFDIDFQDQANLEEIFSKKNTTESYLAHLYSYLPHDEDTHNGAGYVIPRSDEGLFGFLGYGPFNKLRSGDYSTAASGDVVQYNLWKTYYVGIRQCTIFMDYVDLDKEDNQTVRNAMKAEARFLRAFYYFCLFRQYGPVIVWGDRLAPEDVEGKDLDRNTVNENVEFIVSELDKAYADLPFEIKEIGANDSWTGRATKGAALALKSRVLTYAASPLYNGQDGGRLTSIFSAKTNKDGKRIFADYSAEKWQEAADAAKAVIDMNRYDLCKSTSGTTPIQKAASAYQNVFFEQWNSETIWGWWHLGIGHSNGGFATWIGATGSFMYCTIPDFGNTVITTSYRPLQAYTPSLKMVDAYPMEATGRYPVLGYEKSGRQNDLSKPIVDAASGYSAGTSGTAADWEANYTQPVDADWAPAFKAHISTVGRDARYYSSLVPDGFYWPSDKIKKRWTSYKSASATSPVNKLESAALNWVGYACRRWYKANTAFATGSDFTGATRYVYPAFRLAEIYLNYAEACNEKSSRDVDEAIKYLDKVRARSGLNGIQAAYPEINFSNAEGSTTISGVTKTNKEWLRWLILQERWCEFGMEAMRHYDMCRWLRAEDEYPAKSWTLNMASETYEGVYTRVNNLIMLDDADFHYRDYFYPIISTQLAEMVNFTQNPGWE